MPVTPIGNPAWVRSADHTYYGGHVDKVNYQNQPLVNARTDFGAEALARMAADLAAVVRTAPFCKLTYTCSDSVPGPPTIHTVHHMASGVRLTNYVGDSPPAGFPSAARNGNGDVTFTFSASHTDPYGVSGSSSITDADANGHTSGSAVIANPELVTATTVRVRAFNDAGTAVSNAKVTLTVWT